MSKYHLDLGIELKHLIILKLGILYLPKNTFESKKYCDTHS